MPLETRSAELEQYSTPAHIAADIVWGAVEGKFDTVVQNPPFGAQKRHADRAFIKKSLELAPRVYSLHNAGTETFVAGMVESLGARCRPGKRFKFEIPFSSDFH